MASRGIEYSNHTELENNSEVKAASKQKRDSFTNTTHSGSTHCEFADGVAGGRITSENNLEFRMTNCCKLFANAIRNVTVEPCTFLFIFAWSLQSTLTVNLLLEKTCSIYFNYSETICQNLSNHQYNLDQVQRYVNNINLANELLHNIPSAFFVLVLGAWSDKHGRKVPMILPLLGYFLATLLLLVNVYQWDLPPVYILLTTIPKMVTGGFPTFFMVIFSYATDISDAASRSMRVGFIDISFALASPCGLYASSFVYKKLGYGGTFIVSAFMYLKGILYVLFRIKETRGYYAREHVNKAKFICKGMCCGCSVYEEVSPEDGDNSQSCTDSDTDRQIDSTHHHSDSGELGGRRDEENEEHPPTLKDMLKDLFSCENLYNAVHATFRARPDGMRLNLLLFFAAMMFMVFTQYGQLDYVYVKKKFDWSYYQYIDFTVIKILSITFFTGLFLVINRYVCHWNELILSSTGCLMAVASSILQSFAWRGYVMYISIVLSVLVVLPLIYTRSAISKAVHADEIGSIFSAMGIIESTLSLLSVPVFTVIYNSTLSIFPGAIYSVGAMLYAFAGIIFLLLFCRSSRCPVAIQLDADREC